MVRQWGASIEGVAQQALGFFTGNLLTQAIAGINRFFGELNAGMIGGNAQFEDFNARFTVLLGNAELAADRMEALARFGALTPFDLPGVVQADVVLQGFGLHAADVASRFGKSGEEIRTIAGDVASGTGESFDKISEYLGRFASGDTGFVIRRMQQLGIVTRETMEAMGLEFDKGGELISPIEEAMTFLLNHMEQKYGGLMEVQSHTFNGMMSNLRDWMGMAMRFAGEPIFDRLKVGLEELLKVLQTDEARRAFELLGEVIGDVIDIMGVLIGMLTGGLSFSITDFVQQTVGALEEAHAFLQQLKDELMGLTAGDILGQLGPGLEDLQNRMNESLADLETRHNETVTNITQMMTNAKEKFDEGMAAIAEKYDPKLADLQENFEQRQSDIRKRQRREEEDFNDQMRKLEEQRAEVQSNAEERLTELKADHSRRRNQLVMNLLTAESEEQYLNIQAQIKAEDEKYEEDRQRAETEAREQQDDLDEREREIKKSHQRTTDDLAEQMERETREYEKQRGRILAERAKAEAAVKESYEREMRMLQNKLDAENKAHEDNRQKIIDSFQQQMADFEADIQARAAAIGSGPAHEAALFIQDMVARFNELKAVVSSFLSEYGTPLLGLLIGIGAVLVGGGVLAALSALIGLISGIGLPVLALVGTVALLYTAWTENWGGIQQKTQEVLAWLETNVGPTWQVVMDGAMRFWQTLTNLWTQYGPQVMALLQAWWAATQAFWSMVWSILSSVIGGGLALIQGFWQQHGDYVLAIVQLAWENIKVAFEAALTILTAIFNAFTAAREGDWYEFGEQLRIIWDTALNAIGEILANWSSVIGETFEELVETIFGIFEGQDWASIGTSILEGIGSGLSGTADWLSQTATDSAQALEDAYNGFFGIHSPSELMKKLGRQLPPGLGLGMEEAMPALQRQVEAMLNQVMPGQLLPALAARAAGPVQFNQYNQYPPMPAEDLMPALLEKTGEQTKRILGRVYDES